MVEARKSLTKRTRFVVFKRDDFTCQYCGRKAPDVVLHVDHIDPVCNGGSNRMGNLVTSCQDCNLGKGGESFVAGNIGGIDCRLSGIEDIDTRLSLIFEHIHSIVHNFKLVRPEKMGEFLTKRLVDAILKELESFVNKQPHLHERQYLNQDWRIDHLVKMKDRIIFKKADNIIFHPLVPSYVEDITCSNLDYIFSCAFFVGNTDIEKGNGDALLSEFISCFNQLLAQKRQQLCITAFS